MKALKNSKSSFYRLIKEFKDEHKMRRPDLKWISKQLKADSTWAGICQAFGETSNSPGRSKWSLDPDWILLVEGYNQDQQLSIF